MPELPEVEVVCRYLSDKIVGLTIVHVLVRRHDLRLPIPDSFGQLLQGLQIDKVFRRAKYINCVLNNGMILLIHLGMSGRLTFGKPTEYSKHDHVILRLHDGNVLRFNDPRRFGLVLVVKKEDNDFFTRLGIEPLTDEFTAPKFTALLHNKKCNIKSFLLNNKNVVGIGNIYASEALFRANISPLRTTAELLSYEIEKLHASIQEVLQEAILAGGSTLKDYIVPNGSTGKFQNKFAVYARAGQNCINCNTTINSTRQNGRSTFYCPKCQP